MNQEFLAIDLFAGMGCASMGFRNAGFRILSALEIDELRCDNYELIMGKRPLEEDVANVEGEELLSEAGLKRGEKFCLISCPPCQSFSKLSLTRRINALKDPRSRYVLKFAELVAEMKPMIVVFENVRNMAVGEGKFFFNQYISKLDKIGYRTLPGLLDAVDYGVPQHRKRVVAISVLKENKATQLLSLPEKISELPEEQSKKYPWHTVFDAIADLKPLAAGWRDRNDPLHYARNHSKEILERIKRIPKNGGSRTQLPPRYWLNCHKTLAHGAANSVYGRLRWESPAPTMTCRCVTPSCGRFLHPIQNRGITLREAARFQTIPDNVHNLKGSMDQIGEMIGDAVPVNLAERIAIKAAELMTA